MMKRLLICVSAVCLLFALSSCKQSVDRSPSSQVTLSETTSAAAEKGGIPSEYNSVYQYKFNSLNSQFSDYAVQYCGHDASKPVDGDCGTLYMIDYLGIDKKTFIMANSYGGDEYKEFTDAEIDILFGDDERAKKELVSPYSIWVGDTCYVFDWYVSHPVSEWVSSGTTLKDLERIESNAKKREDYAGTDRATTFSAKLEEFREIKG